MKHNIEVNGVTQKMEFNLGSGILDCNGREIFEGHRVKVYGHLSNAAVREVVYHDVAVAGWR